MSCGSPSPRMYLLARLYCACANPVSADRERRSIVRRRACSGISAFSDPCVTGRRNRGSASSKSATSSRLRPETAAKNSTSTEPDAAFRAASGVGVSAMPGFGSGVGTKSARRSASDRDPGTDCADWEGGVVTSGFTGEMTTVVVAGRPGSDALGASDDCVPRCAAGGEAVEGTDNGDVRRGASGDGAWSEGTGFRAPITRRGRGATVSSSGAVFRRPATSDICPSALSLTISTGICRPVDSVSTDLLNMPGNIERPPITPMSRLP